MVIQQSVGGVFFYYCAVQSVEVSQSNLMESLQTTGEALLEFICLTMIMVIL